MCPSALIRKYPRPQPLMLYSFSASLVVQIGGAMVVAIARLLLEGERQM
jgi:hypothetical protein